MKRLLCQIFERVPTFGSFLAVRLTLLLVVALYSGCILGEEAHCKEPTDGRLSFFSLCMDTHDSNKRTLPQQAEMIQSLGFDGAGHLWLAGIPERLKTLDAQGLRLFQIYMGVDLSKENPYDKQIEKVLPLLKGRDVQLAVLVQGGKPGDPAMLDKGIKILGELADMAAKHGVTVALYPHRNFWLERVDFCLKVADKIDRANVGVMFNLCHWAAHNRDEDLRPQLQRAMPKLVCVTINGSDTPAAIQKKKGRWILPLDEGDYSVQERVLGTLLDLGYDGPVGLQCYGIKGNAKQHLERSIKTWNSWWKEIESSRKSKTKDKLSFDPTGRLTLEWMPAPVAIPESIAQTESEMKRYTEKPGGKGVTFEMVPIPGGSFFMGSPEGEEDRKKDEGPQRRISVEPFWMGRCEVTWDEYNLWAKVFTGELFAKQAAAAREASPEEAERIADAISKPSQPYGDVSFGMGKSGYPAVGITQLAARCYCKWLSAKTGRYYRLPTEAEWEYAARAGTTTAWSFGDDLDDLEDYAWYFDNAEDKYQKVGKKRPNPWGLYDMYGNASEWTLDQYHADRYHKMGKGPHLNPFAAPTTEYPRVVRGGCWDSDPEDLRSAARGQSTPQWKKDDPRKTKSIWFFTDPAAPGFRVVRPLRRPTLEASKHYEPDNKLILDYLGLREKEKDNEKKKSKE